MGKTTLDNVDVLMFQTATLHAREIKPDHEVGVIEISKSSNRGYQSHVSDYITL